MCSELLSAIGFMAIIIVVGATIIGLFKFGVAMELLFEDVEKLKSRPDWKDYNLVGLRLKTLESKPEKKK